MENIDAIIEAELPEIVETEAVETEQAESPETEETEAQEEKRLTEAEWLKKERNTVSRRDKQLAKERQRTAELAAEVERYRSQVQAARPQAVSDERPNPDRKPDGSPWGSYHEFLQADQKYERAQDLKALREELTAKDTHSVASYKEHQFIQQSDHALQNATLEYAKQVPNIEKMIQQHGETISALPEGIKRVIREVDPQDVIKAFHAMVENDTLEDLADMTPTQAAAAIVRAASMPSPKRPISRAPAPMASARGTSSGVKTLNTMSPSELVDWVNS